MEKVLLCVFCCVCFQKAKLGWLCSGNIQIEIKREKNKEFGEDIFFFALHIRRIKHGVHDKTRRNSIKITNTS